MSHEDALRSRAAGAPADDPLAKLNDTPLLAERLRDHVVSPGRYSHAEGGDSNGKEKGMQPPVLPPAIDASSPYLQALTREEQVQLLLEQLAVHSKRTAMTFVPLCPPPLQLDASGKGDLEKDLHFQTYVL
jgi:hypothetical protein